jgi:hypothetical protein
LELTGTYQAPHPKCSELPQQQHDWPFHDELAAEVGSAGPCLGTYLRDVPFGCIWNKDQSWYSPGLEGSDSAAELEPLNETPDYSDVVSVTVGGCTCCWYWPVPWLEFLCCWYWPPWRTTWPYWLKRGRVLLLED